MYQTTYAGGFPGPVDLAQWVQDAGGDAPIDGPGRITMDIRVDVTGDITELRRLGFDTVWAGGWGAQNLNGDPYDGDASGTVLRIRDDTGEPINATDGVWNDDFELLSWTDKFPAQLLLHPNMFWTYDPNNPFPAGVKIDFYLDDLKVEYTPEPSSLVLLALAGLPLFRRRRR
jgi:hypothetical protein